MGFEIKNGILKKYTEEAGVTDVIIPDSVTSVGVAAFSHCRSLTSITIPDSVTSIGDEAFLDCESLTSITIPDSVTSVGDMAFLGCESLTSITIPDSVTSIGDMAFSYCDSLTSVTIPESLTSFYKSFWTCEGLKSVIIGNGVTFIDSAAFMYCSNLTSITIPDSVTSIGESAFSETPWLEEKRKNNPLVVINNILIDGKYCEGNVVIPDGVTSIGGEAFLGCENLTGITIPDSVTAIGVDAFANGTKILFNKNGVKITVLWDAKEGDLLVESINQKSHERCTEIFNEMKTANCKIPLAIYMTAAYDDEFFKAYINKSLTKVMKYIIDNNDIDSLSTIFSTGFLTKNNIDKQIDYAIENTQKGGSLELQMTLMRYRHDNFSDDSKPSTPKKFRI